MTEPERLINLLAANPTGLDEAGVRAGMGWPAHRQIGPYITGARAKLRQAGGSQTIPYRRIGGGDLFRLVDVIDLAAWEADNAQRSQARTRVEEMGKHWEREGDRLTKAGKNREAVDAYQAAAQLDAAAQLI